VKPAILAVMGVVALGAAGAAVVPRGIDAAALFAGSRDDESAIAYDLASRSARSYETAIADALVAQDEDLAASLVSLAEDHRISLSGDVIARVRQAETEARDRGMSDAWDGFVSGKAPNESALAGAVAADFSGYGDMRDLFNQASAYASGEEVDTFLVGLAAVGLGLTVATYASDGLAFPARSGVSTLKAARRAGRLSPRLVKHVGSMAADAFDRQAFSSMASSLKRFDFTAARASAASLVQPQSLKAMSQLGTDISTVGGKLGYRGTLQTLAVAENAGDIGKAAKLSTRFGKATRAVIAFGGLALTFASVAASAAFWLVSALLWVLGAALFLSRIALWVGRKLWPSRRQPKLQAA
jgi:hypothetical protein